MVVRSRRNRRSKAEVNIVPMVDVLTVLIFFFLLTMQFKEVYAVNVTPPEMHSASSIPSSERPPRIVVDSDGKYFIDTEETDIAGIRAKFAEIVEKNRGASVIILSDKETPLHFVTAVIDLAKLAKVKKMSLQTQSK